MESNPAVGLLGFWMLLQLFATLALLIGGIYLMYCVGRAASGLDRMANAMEDWVALQTQAAQNATSQTGAPASTPVGSTPPAPSVPPAYSTNSPEPRPEYSLPDEPNRQL